MASQELPEIRPWRILDQQLLLSAPPWLRGPGIITSHFSDYNQLHGFSQLESEKCTPQRFINVTVLIASNWATIRTRSTIGS